MIGLIVTGHGKFGSGITSSLELIAGPQKHYCYIDFPQESSVEDLTNNIIRAMDKLHDCDSILILADLLGGSPFKTAVEIGHPRGNVDILAGTNLAMLIEASINRKIMTDMDELVKTVLAAGKDQIIHYEFKKIAKEDYSDGI